MNAISDSRLSFCNGVARLLVPRDGTDQVLLQTDQVIDEFVNFALGRVSCGAFENSAVEDLAALMLKALQRLCRLLQDLRVLLGAIIETLLIGLYPSARLEHLHGVFTGGLGNSHG